MLNLGFKAALPDVGQVIAPKLGYEILDGSSESQPVYQVLGIKDGKPYGLELKPIDVKKGFDVIA